MKKLRFYVQEEVLYVLPTLESKSLFEKVSGCQFLYVYRRQDMSDPLGLFRQITAAHNIT